MNCMAGPVQPKPLVLATSSPRRLALMRQAGYEFAIQANELIEPEPMHPDMTPGSYAEAIAFFKAASVAPRFPNHVVMGADTTCFVAGRSFSKPADRADAEQMLRKLSGTTHQVFTGVALYDPTSARRLLAHDVTTIRFKLLSDREIDEYLASGEWDGKAGAYGIQDTGDAFVEAIEGSFSNVVGLPLELVGRLFVNWCENRTCPGRDQSTV